ncbi:bactofilin family protein [Gilvimarinus algae]|uniref:Polymer-forming cytoskeletal protein n=1 Tax=Gilvimarinus algae TaxID=3058037 RepID=A0ABT8TIW4_9GAMM|nr:polymer-forming cytoskeletal protein [Gilvimarinus sp. SDUM040014]MDO3383424.1 polymer-forming cytoskeletal protein [Gilvimarinus sp. SDUM040014]
MAFNNNHTLISKGTSIVGDIHFTGDLQVEGKVTGNIIVEGGGDAKLVVADKGVVEGEIRVPMVVVNGKVVGNVFASKHVELASKAVVEGNVHYQLIEMVKGAQVNGSLVYGEPEKAPVKESGKLFGGKSNDAEAPAKG